MESDGGSPLQAFFAKYPTFDYNPTGSPVNEFGRMCRFFLWGRTPPQKDAYDAFRDALISEFNWKYGTDATSLDSWQVLCKTVGVSPIPDTVRECRDAVTRVHVNLVDLIDPSLVDETVRTFDTERELAVYTKKNKKFFPKDEAKAGGVLKHLLRQILRYSKRGDFEIA